jgi:hypothetical protein
MPIIHDEPTLTEECQAVEHEFPGWHVWHSDAGEIYATHVRTPRQMEALESWTLLWAGAGVTVFAHSPALARYAIARYQRCGEVAA